MKIQIDKLTHQTLAGLFEAHLSCKSAEQELQKAIKVGAAEIVALKKALKAAPLFIEPNLLDQLHFLSTKNRESQATLRNLLMHDNEVVDEITGRLQIFPGKLVRLSIKNVNYFIARNETGSGFRWNYDTGLQPDRRYIRAMTLSTGARG